MVRRRSLRLGEGARCSVLVKNLRPSREITERILNPLPMQRVTDLVATRREIITRGRSTYEAIFFTSPTFPDVELHAAKRYTVVDAEGHPDRIWTTVLHEDGTEATPADPNSEREIDPAIFRATDNIEDIARVRAEGFEVDDDNEALPENRPALDAPPIEVSVDGLLRGQRWGWDGVDERSNKGGYEKPSFENGWMPCGKTYLDIFLRFLPFVWIENVLLRKTSDALEKNNSHPLTISEFLRYLGIHLLMATIQGFGQVEFWDYSGVAKSQEEGACPYNLKDYMSFKRFQAITSCLVFTQDNPPTFRDKFWQIREMVREWNKIMKEFISGWVICVDESMSSWINCWTCPGWIFCPRKPHPFGNEWHTACCGLSGILFAFELVEGKDAPPQIEVPHAQHGKTTGLLLRMLQTYFWSGKYVVLDSGFCVLKAIIELRKVGVFACALIKKRQSWPIGVPGDAMQRRFDRPEVTVGDVDAITGVQDDVPYFIWGMKEPDYVMRMMATGGPLGSTEECRETKRRCMEGDRVVERKFKYTCPYDWHFRYRHAVDDHNNLRHATPAVEESWITKRWECRVFCFLLAVSEINSFLALRYFVFGNNTIEGCPLLIVFRRRLAWQLINNNFLRNEAQEAAARAPPAPIHQLVTAPNHARKWSAGAWICDASYQYQGYFCSMKCKKRIRTYCVCDPGRWLCKDCLVTHAQQHEHLANM